MSQKSSYKAKVQKAVILQAFLNALEHYSIDTCIALRDANPEYIQEFKTLWAASDLRQNNFCSHYMRLRRG